MTNPRARAARPDPAAYLPGAGLSRAQRAAEQDAAAGGRFARLIEREDGTTAAGSVALRCYPTSRRVYAYLRWATDRRRTTERYLGDVSDSPDRDAALREAWARVRHGEPVSADSPAREE